MNAPNIYRLQPCNGSFLCESFDDEDDNVFSYFICNVTTKKFKMLSFPRNPIKDCQFSVNFAFDPIQSPHYKIISIREASQESFKFEMDICSSDTDSWTASRISFDVDEEECITFEDAVFCNGMIHWNSYGNESLCFDPGPGVKIGSIHLDLYNHLHEQRFLAYKYFVDLSCI